MDKKNTMLLTVIAVATLLVAVVGATFAYFSLDTNVSRTTNVNATTTSAAIVTITNNQPNLGLVLTAEDMLDKGSNVPYYAIVNDSDNDGTASGGKWSSDAIDAKVGDFSISGGNESDEYSCTLTVKITNENASEDDDMIAGLTTTGWAVLTIKGLEGESDSKTYDLNSLKTTDATNGKTYTTTFKYTPTTAITRSVTANLVVNNLTGSGNVQDSMANSELDINVEFAAACNLVPKASRS